MACTFKVALGSKVVEYDSMEKVKNALMSRVSAFAAEEKRSLNKQTIDNPLMLIPDFTTKLKVVMKRRDNNGKIVDGKFDTVYFDHDTLVSYIENNIDYDRNLQPEEVLAAIIKGNPSYGITVYTPKIPMKFTKEFYGYSLIDLPSDNMLEVLVNTPKGIEVFSGPASYLKKKLKGFDNIHVSIINRKIKDERKLNSYDYTINRDIDGKNVSQSIKDTDEYTSLWELYNKKPKNKGKFSRDILIAYLSFNRIKPADRAIILAKYKEGLFDESVIDGITINDTKHEGLTVDGLTKLVSEFLNVYEIKKVASTDNDLENAVNKAKRVKGINDWEMHFRAYFRKKLISRIDDGGYKFKPSEGVGMMVNASRLGIRRGDTIHTIEHTDKTKDTTGNAEAYFLEVLKKDQNYISGVPMYDIFNSDKIYSVEDIAIIRDSINDNLFSKWKWFESLKGDISNLMDNVSDEAELNKAVRHLFFTKLGGKMYDELSVKRAESYFKSKTVITTRIPSQAKQSTSISEMKIMDNTIDNYWYEAHENFIIKGQDNDGDKLNTMTQQLDEHGVVIPYTDFLTDGKFVGLDINKTNNFVFNISSKKNKLREDKLLSSNDERGKVEYNYLIEERKKIIDAGMDTESIDNDIQQFLVSRTNVTTEEETNIINSEIHNLNDNTESKQLVAQFLDPIDARYNEAIEAVKSDYNIENVAKEIKKLLQARANEKAIVMNTYKKAMVNYIVDQIIVAHSKSHNAIEKEIPVDNVITNSIIEQDDINSINDDRSDTERSEAYINDTLVGTVANYIQLANIMKEVSTNVDPETFKNYRGEPIDLSYMVPYFVDGEKKYKKVKVLISDLLAFTEASSENKMDFNSLHSLTDVDGNAKDIDTDIDAYIEWKRIKDTYDSMLDGKEELKSLLDNANKLSDAEFTNELYKGKIWEDLSEIMTGAVDNAKLLVLSKLGINNSNAKMVLTMLLYGVSITDTIAIIRQKDIVNAAQEVTKKANNGKITSIAKELGSVSSRRQISNDAKKAEVMQVKSLLDANKSYEALDVYYKSLFNDDNAKTDLNIYTIGGQGISSFEGINNITIESVSTNEGTLDSKFSKALTDSNTVILNIDKADTENDKVKEAIASGNNIILNVNNELYIVNKVDGNIELAKMESADNFFMLIGNVFVYNIIDGKDIILPSKVTTLTKNNIRNFNTDGSATLMNFTASFAEEFKKSTESVENNDNDRLKYLLEYDYDYDPAGKLAEFDGLVKEINTMISVTGFKNGKNNSAHDMNQYVVRIEKAVNKMFKANGDVVIDFDLVKFANDTVYQGQLISQYNDYKKGINPLLMLLQSTTTRNYLKVIGKQESKAMLGDNITSNKKILYKRIFKDDAITRRTQGIIDETINSFIVYHYANSDFNNLKTFKIGDKVIDLTTKQGMHEFMIEFPKSIVAVKNNEPIVINKGTNKEYTLNVENNLLLKHLRNSGYSREELGLNAEFIKLSKESVDSDITPLIKSAAKKIKEGAPEFYKALFLYDLIQAGGSYSKDNIAMVLDDDMRVAFNNSNINFNFDKIADIDLNYLFLLKPGLIDKINRDVKTAVKIDNKVITVPIKIGENTVRVPVVRTQISQTGSDIVTVADGLSMTDIVRKAGYELGYEVTINTADGKVDGRVLAYNGNTDTYYVIKSNGVILDIQSTDIADSNPDMYFSKAIFGPKSKMEDIVSKDYNRSVHKKEQELIANDTVRYDIIGKESVIGFANEHEVGFVIQTKTFGYSKYELVYKGVKRPSDTDADFRKRLNKAPNTKAFDIKDSDYYKTKNDEFAYAEWVVVKRGNDPIPENRIKPEVAEKLKLKKPLTATRSRRSPFLWVVKSEKSKQLRLSNKGDKGSVKFDDKVYVLTNKTEGYHWKHVANQLGIDTSNETKAKEILIDYLQVDFDNENTHDLIRNFFDTKEEDVVKLKDQGKLQPIMILSAVPESLSGSNNTYEESKLIGERTSFSENINKQNKIRRVIANSPETRVGLGASILHVKESKAQDDTIALVTQDFKLLFKENNDMSPELEATIGTISSAIKDSDAVVIEGTSLVDTREDMDSDNRRVSRVANIHRLSSAINFIAKAEKDGIISPKALLDKLTSLQDMFYAEDSLNPKDKGQNKELEKYRASVFDSGKYDTIVNEIKLHYDYSLNASQEWVYTPDTGNGIGRSRVMFASKESSFVALQSAKYLLEKSGENKDLYFFSINDNAWFKYNYSNGYFDKVHNIPNVDRNIAYLGESDLGLDLMVKVTSIRNEKVIDPAFMPPHTFIVDENTEFLSDNEVEVKSLDYTFLPALENANKVTEHNGNYFLDDSLVITRDIKDFSTYKINKYKDGLYVLESDESNNVYIINMTDELRKSYDSLGEELDVDNLVVTFDKVSNIIFPDSVFSFNNLLKVNKSVFARRGTVSDVNTKIKKDKVAIQEFAKKNIEDRVNKLQRAIANNPDARDDHYSNMYSYNDFMNMLELGVLDRFIPNNPYYETIKDELIKFNSELKDMKDKYYEYIRIETEKNKRNDVTVESINYNGEIKVYFSNNSYTDRDTTVKANSDLISSQDINGRGFNTNDNYTDADGNHTSATTMGVDVSSNEVFLVSSINDMFAKARNRKEPIYISFGRTYDKNGDLIEIYPGITNETLAKAIAQILRKKVYTELVVGDNPLIRFNEEATKMINNTNGVYSMSDINSNKIYRVTDIPEGSFNLNYSIDLSTMKIDDYSVMQHWNQKLGYGINSDNNNKYAKPKKGSELDGINHTDKQKSFTNLLKRYYQNNHTELVSLMRKLKGRNIYMNQINADQFKVEQSFVDIINDVNSIDFLFGQEIKPESIDFNPASDRVALVQSNKVAMVEGQSKRLVDDSGLYKVTSEVKVTNSNVFDDRGDINPLLSAYGITKENVTEHLEFLREEGNYLTLVSIVPFGDKITITTDRLTPAFIADSGYDFNENLDEQSIDRVTIALPVNIKGTVMTRTGLDKSKNIRNMVDSLGNTSIVTDIKTSDVVLIKSPNYGDMNSTTQDDFYDAYKKMAPYLERIVKSGADVILSGGVTVNEFIKAFLTNNNYGYDVNNGIYSLNTNNENLEGLELFKISHSNMHSIISNRENGRSGLPFIASKDESGATSHKGLVENTDPKSMQKVIHINPDKLVSIDYEVPQATVNSIIEEYKPNSFNDDDKLLRLKSEHRSVTYIKLAVAVDLIGDIALPEDINKALGVITNTLSDNPDLETAYRERLKGFISEDGFGNTFDESLSKTKRFNMIADFNSIKVYLKEDFGIDIFYLNSSVANFDKITEFAMYQKVYKRSRLYKKFIQEEDFDISNINVLDLFLFSTVLDNNNGFDSKGNIDFGSVPHTFVVNGINGIKLSNGDYSLFETMSLFNKDNSAISIMRPTKKLDKVNETIRSIYGRLNRSERYGSLARVLNNTAIKNIPFTVSGNDIVYYTWDGSIKNINLAESGSLTLLNSNIVNSVFASAMKSINVSVSDNIEVVRVNSRTDISKNINAVLRGKKGLDQINLHQLLFNNIKDIVKISDNLNNANVGNVYEYNNEKVVILYNKAGSKIAISESGKIDKANSNINTYLLPKQYNHTGMIVVSDNDGNTNIIDGVTVNIDGLAINADETESYKYNYNLNVWELSTEEQNSREFSSNIYAGHYGSLTINETVMTDEEFKNVKLLNLVGGTPVRLSKDAKMINPNTIEDNNVSFNLSNDKIHWVMDNEGYQLRSEIDKGLAE